MTRVGSGPVRDGVLAVGGDEAVAECDGRAVLVGSGCAIAAARARGDRDPGVGARDDVRAGGVGRRAGAAT